MHPVRKRSFIPDVSELTARIARALMEAGTDHFGVWVVEISYGRIGTAGPLAEAALFAMKRRPDTWPKTFSNAGSAPADAEASRTASAS